MPHPQSVRMFSQPWEGFADGDSDGWLEGWVDGCDEGWLDGDSEGIDDGWPVCWMKKMLDGDDVTKFKTWYLV